MRLVEAQAKTRKTRGLRTATGKVSDMLRWQWGKLFSDGLCEFMNSGGNNRVLWKVSTQGFREMRTKISSLFLAKWKPLVTLTRTWSEERWGWRSRDDSLWIESNRKLEKKWRQGVCKLFSCSKELHRNDAVRMWNQDSNFRIRGLGFCGRK